MRFRVVSRVDAITIGGLSKAERCRCMCRNIKTLFNFEPPATDDEVRAAALQFVRKLSGFNAPSQANAAAFDRAVSEITDVAARCCCRCRPRPRRATARSRRRRRGNDRARGSGDRAGSSNETDHASGAISPCACASSFSCRPRRGPRRRARSRPRHSRLRSRRRLHVRQLRAPPARELRRRDAP